MGQGKWEVEFYVTRDGSSPITEFLDSLTAREYRSVDQAIARLATYGRDLDRPHVGYLRDQI